MAFSGRFERVRFHVETGPDALFTRVRHKMAGVRHPRTDGAHFQSRTQSRNIPEAVLDRIAQFDSESWELKTASVRSDTGKFVDSTWEMRMDGTRYWVTIGLGDLVTTIVEKTSSGRDKAVASGLLYEYVAMVNQRLNETDAIDQ